MTPEEIAAQKAEMLAEVKKASAAGFAEKETAIKAEITELKEQIKLCTTQKSVNEISDSLKAKFDELSLHIESKMEADKTQRNNRKSFAVQVVESLESQKDALAKLKDRKGDSVRLEIKSAGTFTTGNITPVGTGGLSMLLNDYEPGLTPIPRSQPFFAELLNTAATTGMTVSYAEMKNPDGGAGMTAEGAAKTQADFDIVEAKATVRKITSYIKVSKEALEDIPQIASEINGELATLINLKKDDQLMNGDNTGQNLNGVIPQATAYSAGAFAGTIFMANNFDVLATAVAQVMTAEVVSGEPAGFMPTAIVINTIDFMAMKLTKDDRGQYLFPVILPGITQVIQVPVVVNARMTEGEFLVGDFTKANVRVREGVTFSIGYENDDFTKNLVTILAETRLTSYIKSNHLKAFVTGDFATAIAALEIPT